MKTILFGKAIFVLLVLCGFILLIGYFYSTYNCKQVSEVTLTEWQQLSNLTYGAFGIILGYLYFSSKVVIDRDIAKKDRARNRIAYIREELIQIDKLIEQILIYDIKNADELSKIRLEIDKRFMLLMNNYLENNENLIGFTNNELNSIVTLNSFVTNSKIISEVELDSLTKIACSKERLEYLSVFYEATGMCMQKIENL